MRSALIDSNGIQLIKKTDTVWDELDWNSFQSDMSAYKDGRNRHNWIVWNNKISSQLLGLRASDIPDNDYQDQKLICICMYYMIIGRCDTTTPYVIQGLQAFPKEDEEIEPLSSWIHKPMFQGFTNFYMLPAHSFHKHPKIENLGKVSCQHTRMAETDSTELNEMTEYPVNIMDIGHQISQTTIIKIKSSSANACTTWSADDVIRRLHM